MDRTMFGDNASGHLVPFSGADPHLGAWDHVAFVPDPLPDSMPPLSAETYLQVANARAALGALDSTAQQLPNPHLFRSPALRREAQSTSALEGTYAPLADVLALDRDDELTGDLREIFNYVLAAEQGFAWQADRRPLTTGALCELQRVLVRDTSADTSSAGDLRDIQVVIGRAAGHPVTDARFIPHPPGDELARRVRELIDWINTDHTGHIDPVVKTGMAHYQFETLHPFNDGNGRIGRLLIIMQLQATGVLGEPTLTVSPWFEQRRTDYYDRLLAVSTHSAWDEWLRFFVTGIEESARRTRDQMRALITVHQRLHDQVRASNMRAGSAHDAIDLAVARPAFTVRTIQSELGLSYGRANKLVTQLTELGIFETMPGHDTYRRRFQAPAVLDVLLHDQHRPPSQA